MIIIISELGCRFNFTDFILCRLAMGRLKESGLIDPLPTLVNVIDLFLHMLISDFMTISLLFMKQSKRDQYIWRYIQNKFFESIINKK